VRLTTLLSSAGEGRSCGACSLCCRLLEISSEHAPEIAKPAGAWCRHCVKPGCGIYASRPSLCRDFECHWLSNPRLGDEWYPPTSGMVLTFADSTLNVVVDPDRPDAWLAEPYNSQIARMTRWGKIGPEPFEVKIAGVV